MINNRNGVRQLIDFDGLRWGNMRPTDIDAVMEIRNKLFLFIEAKYRDKGMDTGQKIAIQNICNAIHKPDERYCYGILVEHEVADTSRPIILAECKVREIWSPMEGAWANQEKRPNIKKVIDHLLNKYGIAYVDPMEKHRDWLADHDAYDARGDGITFPAPNPAGI
jgi:hypothetical protein